MSTRSGCPISASASSYSLLNDREDTAAERVFCPWPDMADALRKHGRPAGFSLETGRPLKSSSTSSGSRLQYEMTFTNVLEMLDLAGIPLRSAPIAATDDPLVVVGGPVVFNVEPLADFVDLVFVGRRRGDDPRVPRPAEDNSRRARAPRRERSSCAAGRADRGHLRPGALRPWRSRCPINGRAHSGRETATRPVSRACAASSWTSTSTRSPTASSCRTVRSCTTACRSRSCAVARSVAASVRPDTSTGRRASAIRTRSATP